MSTTVKHFTSDLFPNIHLELNAQGCLVCVSLNIEVKLKQYLSPNNVYKSNKFWCYVLKQQINVVNIESVNIVQRELLDRAMINIRSAKIKMIGDQIKFIKNKC